MAQRRQILFFVTHRVDRGANIEHDKIALEDHSYVEAKPEKNQNTTHWVLGLNQDSAQQPPKQRPDFAQTKRECKWMHEKHVDKTRQEYRPILRDQQSRQRRGQAFEGIDEHDYWVDPRTGWRFFNSESQETRRLRPRQQIGILTVGRREVGILGILRGLTIRDFPQS